MLFYSTFPIMLWFYYEFPIYSFLLNLVIIPAMGMKGNDLGLSMYRFRDFLLGIHAWNLSLSGGTGLPFDIAGGLICCVKAH